MVMTPQGIKEMSQVIEGDKLLGFKDGKEVFSEVTSWFHHESDKSAEYLKV